MHDRMGHGTGRMGLAVIMHKDLCAHNVAHVARTG